MTEHPFRRDDGSTEHAIEQSIAAKERAQSRRVDSQGRPIDAPVDFTYDEHGRLLGPVKGDDDPPAA